MKKNLLFVFVMIISLHADTLTLPDAVAIGLENNYSIRISKIDEYKSTNNKQLKTGALLPSVRLDASGTKTASHYFSAKPPGAATSGDELRAGAAFNWTLFDGFQMFHAAKQIDLQADFAALATRHQIESAVSTIITAYYDLVARRSLRAAAEEQLALSQNQYLFVNSQYTFGRIGRRELLTQQVIVNSDSSALFSTILAEKRALYALNLSIGRAPDVVCICTADSTTVSPGHTAAWWYTEALSHNAGLQMNVVKKSIAITRYAINEAAFWPVVSTSGSLYAISQNETDLLRSQVALSVSLPLLSGFTRTTARKNSILDTLSASLTIEESHLELQALVYEQFDRLEISEIQVRFESQAINRARESLTLTEEQFRLGRVSDITLREAQLALLQAQVRYQSALFQNRIVAVQLEVLAGKLLVK